MRMLREVSIPTKIRITNGLLFDELLKILNRYNEMFEINNLTLVCFILNILKVNLNEYRANAAS